MTVQILGKRQLPSLVSIDVHTRVYSHYVGQKLTLRVRANDGPLSAEDVEKFRIDPIGYLAENE